MGAAAPGCSDSGGCPTSRGRGGRAENKGGSGTSDAGAAADRWGMTTQGSRWRWMGAGVNAGERDKWGRQHSAARFGFFNRFKPNQIYFKRIQNSPNFD
jgi:hypothetical protein